MVVSVDKVRPRPFRPSASAPRAHQAAIAAEPKGVHVITKCAINGIPGYAKIVQLVAMARQPQSGQMQDQITRQRQELRERQLRIRCR